MIVIDVDALPVKTSRQLQTLSERVSRVQLVFVARVGYLSRSFSRVGPAWVRTAEHRLTTCGIRAVFAIRSLRRSAGPRE